MKILITGAGGMLGSDLSEALRPFCEVKGIGLSEAPHLKIPYSILDLTHPSEVKKFIQSEKPDIIFHAAAMTDVDGCERNPDLAFKGNFEATKNVCDAANLADSFVVFFSTDYVFDGKKNGEYTEENACSPLSVYGESKRQAEIYVHENSDNCVIIRLAWLYGLRGKSFPRTILERAKSQKLFEVVNDQIGRPTYTKDLAAAFAGILKKDPALFRKWNKEIFHFGNEGSASWAGFAEYILGQSGHQDARVTAISSERLNRPAKRPGNSVLSLEKAKTKLGLEFRPWQTAFLDFLKEFREKESK